MVITTPFTKKVQIHKTKPAPSTRSSFGFSTSSGTGTVFGVPNTPGFGFGSSNSATASTNSSVFGVPNPSAFATGFTTGTSHAFPSTTPGFGINSTKTTGFVFNSTSTSNNNNIFGIKSFAGSPGATKLKPTTGSRLSPYSATCVPDECTEKFQSISAMPVYETKSHEELRLEDYELLPNKGSSNTRFGPITEPAPSSQSSFGFPKSSGTSTVFGVPNTTGIDFKSTPGFGFNSSNSATASTNSSVFDVPNPSAFATGFTTGTSHAFPSTTPGLGINSINTRGFVFNSTTTSGSLFMIGSPGATKIKPTTGSRLSPYSATPVEVNGEICTEKFHSISAMPVYKTKSHEELRLEDYELLPNKGDGPKNCDSQRSPFEPVKLINNPFNVSNNNTTSSAFFSCPSPFSGNSTSELVKNNNMVPHTNNNNPTTLFPNPFNSKPNPISITNPSQTSQVGNEVSYPYNNGQQQQQYTPANTVGAQSSLVADPFPTIITCGRSEIVRPNTVLTSVGHGDSSVLAQVPNKLPSNRRTIRTRRVSSKLNSLPPHKKYSTPSSEPKVAFSHNEVVRPYPLPRENPRAWDTIYSSTEGKCCKDKDLPSSSSQLNNDNEDSVTIAKKHEINILSQMPKLPNENGYYTEPSLNELAAKEMDEPGSLSRVNDFVVGKSGCGSIKFLGEMDVRHLDIGSMVQFNNREVIVYADENTKPEVGKGMNKPAEITLLNVKCVSKKTGKQYVDGPQVQRYKEMLMKVSEQGAEFVSYDPVQGEWKFRVLHF